MKAGFIKPWVPVPVKRLLAEGRESLARSRYKKEIARQPFHPASGSIRVNYGRVLNDPAHPIVRGGKTKLLHLTETFPEAQDRFNILYLVSSAQPRHPLDLVQWAQKQGVKLVWNQDGVAYPAWAGSGVARHNKNMKALIQQADYVIYQSDFCRTSADRYLGPVRAPWEIVYNCVDTGRFSPARTDRGPSPWVLLAVGTHQQPERVLSVLETLALLTQRGRDARLILAGVFDWPQADRQVQEALHRLGLTDRVDLRPAYTQEEAPDLYRQAHLLLHPKYKDPCPTVCLEAMACGLPVIGSRSGGLPELIGEEAGILLTVPDSWATMQYPAPSALAEAVETLAANWPDWSRQARRRAQAMFNSRDWVERHKKIFNRVLGLAG